MAREREGQEHLCPDHAATGTTKNGTWTHAFVYLASEIRRNNRQRHRGQDEIGVMVATSPIPVKFWKSAKAGAIHPWATVLFYPRTGCRCENTPLVTAPLPIMKGA